MAESDTKRRWHFGLRVRTDGAATVGIQEFPHEFAEVSKRHPEPMEANWGTANDERQSAEFSLSIFQ